MADEVVVPEGMMLIVDHQQAMQDLRAELGAAAELRQAEITTLQQQLTDQATASQQALDQKGNELAAVTANREEIAAELLGLRVDFMATVGKTGDGKQAMSRFEDYLDQIQIDGLQQRRQQRAASQAQGN